MYRKADHDVTANGTIGLSRQARNVRFEACVCGEQTKWGIVKGGIVNLRFPHPLVSMYTSLFVCRFIGLFCSKFTIRTDSLYPCLLRPPGVVSGVWTGSQRPRMPGGGPTSKEMQNPPLQMGGFELGWGAFPFCLGGVLLHKKSLGAVKAQNL